MTYCLRVYSNGDRFRELHDEEGVKAWLAENVDFRPGCALFLNGKCVAQGYLGVGQITNIQREETQHIRSDAVLSRVRSACRRIFFLVQSGKIDKVKAYRRLCAIERAAYKADTDAEEDGDITYAVANIVEEIEKLNRVPTFKQST